MSRKRNWDLDSDDATTHRTLQVEVTKPVTKNVLLGPDGNPIARTADRPHVPFGFQHPTRDTR